MVSTLDGQLGNWKKGIGMGMVWEKRVGNSIKYLFPEDSDSADFIILVDRFFDTMNSRQPFADKPYRSGLGNCNHHFNLLNEVYEVFSEMRVTGRKNLLPFQQGLLVSINSVKALYDFLKVKYDLKYLLTHRVNQDVLENFFSQVRGLGQTYDHPTPLETKNRIKLIVYGKALGELSVKGNLMQDSEKEHDYITAMMFSSASVITEDDPDVSNVELELENLINTEDVCSEDISSGSVSFEALKYVAGYVAYRLQNTCPGLGEKEVPLDLCRKRNYLPDWISSISKGGLQHPTKEWMDIVVELEQIFNNIHGSSGLTKMKGITRLVAQKVEVKFPANLHPAIRLFIKTRTMIRMRHMNNKKKSVGTSKRKIMKTIS